MTKNDQDGAKFGQSIPEFKAPFTMAYGPELLDIRLSYGARLLNLWLRFRCYGNTENNYVSYNTLADDFGVGYNTIRDWIKELRDIGSLEMVCENPGGLQLKLQVQPHKVYTAEKLINFHEYTKSANRSPDKLRVMRSEFSEEKKSEFVQANIPFRMSAEDKIKFKGGGAENPAPGPLPKIQHPGAENPAPKVQEGKVEELLKYKKEDPESLTAALSLNADSNTDIAGNQEQVLDRGEEKKEIPLRKKDDGVPLTLSKGHVAWLCERGYAWAKAWKWHLGDRYAVRNEGYRDVDGEYKQATLFLHVELAKEFGIFETDKEVDHADRDCMNNRLDNLRAATRQEQSWNMPKRQNCTSKYKGVYWSEAASKWHARITLDGKQEHIGVFESEEDAAQAYTTEAAKHFGEFAHSNAKERKFDAVIQKVVGDTLSLSDRNKKAQDLLESTITKIKEHEATKAAKQAQKLKQKFPEASDGSWGGLESSRPEKPKTAKDVEAWLKIGIQDYVDPSATLTKWGIEDKNIAKLYLNALDGDWKLAAGVIDYVCKNWSKIGWKDAPYPKMHMIYRDRDELIAKYKNDKVGITTSPEAEKVRGWLQDAVDRHIKLVKLPSWAYQDRESKAAAKLLSDMGEDEAQRLIEFTCREWKNLKEKLKLVDQEYPTISILNSAYGDTIKIQAKKHGITSVAAVSSNVAKKTGVDF